MIHGPIRAGITTTPLDDGVLRLGPPVVLTRRSTLVRVGARIAGGGPSAGAQPVVAVVRDSDLVEIAVSDPISVVAEMDADWLGFTFAQAGMILETGDYTVGVRGAAPANVARVFASLGAADAVFLETLEPYQAPAADDLTLAALPWEITQRALSGGVQAGTDVAMRAGWHGQKHDEQQGAVAIARVGGPLEDLVGQRVRVLLRDGAIERVVMAYVYNAEEWPVDILDEDFSLPLRAWLELAKPAAISIDVLVGVVT